MDNNNKNYDNSLKGYLVKAIYSWCTDNQFTPYLEIQNSSKNLIPNELLETQKNTNLVFNLSNKMVKNLSFNDNGIHFLASVNSIIENIYIDFDGVKKIYSFELQKGLDFTSINLNKYKNLKLVVDNTKS